MYASRRQAGFTLIELLTVMTVIGLLIALLLPAVQQAREAARAMGCKSKLKQMALAALAYHDAHNTFPGWGHFAYSPSGKTTSYSVPSIHARLLPFLDMAAVEERINWNVGISPDFIPSLPGVQGVQVTAATTRIGAFVCPSDPSANRWSSPNNFRAAWGQGPLWHQSHLFPDSQNGAFASGGQAIIYPIKSAFIFDGMSQTTLFSERVIGDGSERNRFARMLIQNGFEELGAFTADDELRVCSALNETDGVGIYTEAGSFWLFSGVHHSLYTHVLPPNSVVSDCVSFVFVVPNGASTARSYHPGSVNIVMADGSAKSITDNVSIAVWRALASRNGGETTNDN